MSTDTSTPVNIADLYWLAFEERMSDLHHTLSQLSTERLHELISKICYELQYIDSVRATPFRHVLNIAMDLHRVRKANEAVARLMGGVA